MAADPGVLAVLAAAVQNDPDNTPLRLHLAEMLAQSGRAAEALENCAAVLARQPDHLEALRLAADAADAAGDPIRAQGYRRLREGLSWNSAKSLLDDIPDRPLTAPGPFAADGPPPREELSQEGRAEARPPEAVPLREGPTGEDGGDADRWESERPTVTLADVAGMEEVKRRLHLSFLAPMRNPDMMKLYGKSLRGGLLMYGPPGCGKTFIARAAAGELGARFLSIGITDVVEMWIGQSEKNLHQIFESARRQAPCVLFFDEVDALGRKRSLMREHAGRNIINQILTEMDSVGSNNDGVFVLAATNHPWDVDTALRRPGRLDRTLLVLPPDAPAREAILRRGMAGRPVQNIDFPWLAARTEDFSGADVAHLGDSATELALDDSLTTGSTRPVRMDDFKRSLKEIRPSVRSWFETARNYALYANEGGVYDDLLNYLRARKLM